jgi:Tol biopolymer transport system component
MTIAKLTDSGNITRAAISPDGKYLACVSQEAQQSLWVRHMATESAVQVVPPTEADHYYDIIFSPDGNYIYFSKEHKNGEIDVYVVPVLGGPPKAPGQGRE